MPSDGQGHPTTRGSGRGHQPAGREARHETAAPWSRAGRRRATGALRAGQPDPRARWRSAAMSITASRARCSSAPAVGPEARLHRRQQRRARPAGDEHAVPEPEPPLVGVVEPGELLRDALVLSLDRRILNGGAVSAPTRPRRHRDRSPAPGTRAQTRSGRRTQARVRVDAAPPDRGSGMACAISRARANRVSGSPNGRAATSRARNRGAPSNSGASASAQDVGVELVELGDGERDAGLRLGSHGSGAAVARQPVRRQQQRDVVAPARRRRSGPPASRPRRSVPSQARMTAGTVRARAGASPSRSRIRPSSSVTPSPTASAASPSRRQQRTLIPGAGRPPAVSSTCVEMVGRPFGTVSSADEQAVDPCW